MAIIVLNVYCNKVKTAVAGPETLPANHIPFHQVPSQPPFPNPLPTRSATAVRFLKTEIQKSLFSEARPWITQDCRIPRLKSSPLMYEDYNQISQVGMRTTRACNCLPFAVLHHVIHLLLGPAANVAASVHSASCTWKTGNCPGAKYSDHSSVFIQVFLASSSLSRLAS